MVSIGQALIAMEVLGISAAALLWKDPAAVQAQVAAQRPPGAPGLPPTYPPPPGKPLPPQGYAAPPLSPTRAPRRWSGPNSSVIFDPGSQGAIAEYLNSRNSSTSPSSRSRVAGIPGLPRPGTGLPRPLRPEQDTGAGTGLLGPPRGTRSLKPPPPRRPVVDDAARVAAEQAAAQAAAARAAEQAAAQAAEQAAAQAAAAQAAEQAAAQAAAAQAAEQAAAQPPAPPGPAAAPAEPALQVFTNPLANLGRPPPLQPEAGLREQLDSDDSGGEGGDEGSVAASEAPSAAAPAPGAPVLNPLFAAAVAQRRVRGSNTDYTTLRGNFVMRYVQAVEHNMPLMRLGSLLPEAKASFSKEEQESIGNEIWTKLKRQFKTPIIADELEQLDPSLAVYDSSNSASGSDPNQTPRVGGPSSVPPTPAGPAGPAGPALVVVPVEPAAPAAPAARPRAPVRPLGVLRELPAQVRQTALANPLTTTTDIGHPAASIGVNPMVDQDHLSAARKVVLGQMCEEWQNAPTKFKRNEIIKAKNLSREDQLYLMKTCPEILLRKPKSLVSRARGFFGTRRGGRGKGRKSTFRKKRKGGK